MLQEKFTVQDLSEEKARPTDEAILTARMIDRAIRPLFPKDFKKEVQVVITCFHGMEKTTLIF